MGEFDDVIVVRDKVTKKQKREIRKSYNKWAREVREQAKQLQRSGDVSSITRARDLATLYYQLRNSSKQLTAEINGSINTNANIIADATVAVNKRWLTSLGFNTSNADFRFAASKEYAIRNIISGNIYSSGFSLSTRIWMSTDGNMKDIYTIIAKGVAEDKSIYQIAKDIEKYVKPDARLPWRVTTGGDGKIYKIKNGTVDYNAQRLAKTVLQHTYQQTLIALTRDNPFVDGYIWHSDGGHPCELCQDRDGQFYTADDVPLDHPNGECTIEPHIDRAKAMSDLAGWYNNPVEYPSIESFASGMTFKVD